VGYSASAASGIAKDLMLPEAKDGPALVTWRATDKDIASPILGNLLDPVPGVRSDGTRPASSASVPEASVNEDDDAYSRDHEVRVSDEARVKAIAPEKVSKREYQWARMTSFMRKPPSI
jgi:hypothetical protein